MVALALSCSCGDEETADARACSAGDLVCADEAAAIAAIRAGNPAEVGRILRERRIDPTRSSDGKLWLTRILEWNSARAAKAPVLREFLAAGLDVKAQETLEGGARASPWRAIAGWQGAPSLEQEAQSLEDGLLALKLVLDRGGSPWPLRVEGASQSETGSAFLELGRVCLSPSRQHAVEVDFATRLFYLVARSRPRDELVARLRVTDPSGAKVRVSDVLRREYERAKAPACNAIPELYDRYEA